MEGGEEGRGKLDTNFCNPMGELESGEVTSGAHGSMNLV